MSDLRNLNKPQQQAVEVTEGPLLVLAGAGSGKTRVLTHRAAYLIDEKGVKPWNVLCITFTNKAAREMRTRINDMVETGANEVTVSTFHSLCLRILFKHAQLLGYDPRFEICDTADQKAVMKQVCKDLEVDTKRFKERTFINAISNAKNELKSPADYAHEAFGDEWYEQVAKVYDRYQRVLKASNTMDFDDLIMQTVNLFKREKEVLEGYQDRFRYIMVDEYQDTNTAQFELIKLLSAKYRNLCVVGDDDQSIYRFRGANIRNILDFEKFYPEAVTVRLEQNYRSTQNILDAANAVIANNEGRKVKSLWTSEGEGDRLNFRQLESASDEAMFVAEDIRAQVKAGRFKYGDCAILMRTNVQSKEFEDAFRVMGIDYDLVKGLRFWDTKIIKDLTSYMMTVASGMNDMRTARIINVPARGIGAAGIEKIRAYATLHGLSMLQVCHDHVDEVPSLGRTAKKAKEFADMVYSLRERSADMSYSQLLTSIIMDFEYDKQMDADADTPEKYNELKDYVDKLKEALDVYEESTPEPDLVDFMRQNGLEGNNLSSSAGGAVIQRELTPEEEEEQREKKVLIMTMHNAKGLEFPNVYLVGMEDGLFPGFASVFSEDEEDMEEERRLCYVAITRAKERLTMVCAKHRMVNGETRYSKTSRFIKEIPIRLMDMKLPDRERGGGCFEPEVPTKVKAIPRRSENVYSNYAKAMKGSQIGVRGELSYGVSDRVRHVKFGEGTVLEIKNGGRDYEVTVEFDSCGVKRMFAGFAKLVKV